MQLVSMVWIVNDISIIPSANSRGLRLDVLYLVFLILAYSPGGGTGNINFNTNNIVHK